MTLMMTTGPTSVERLQRQSLGLLLEEMSDTLLTFARRRVGVDRSEEILADVFEAAVRADQADREVNAAWLMTVARNKVVDHWRRTERETRLLDKMKAECPVFDEHDPNDFNWTHGEVAVALGKLQARHRTILVRHYVAGEPLGAIARSEGVSYQAIESAMARARRSFRNEYAA